MGGHTVFQGVKLFAINTARLGQVPWRCEQEAAGGSGEAVSLLIGGWPEPLLLTSGVSIRKKLHSLFLPLRKRDPLSKTSEALAFRVGIPFALFDTDISTSNKYGRSAV